MHTRLQLLARGFTLIEVLVTVVIIAIGLLGLAGIQMTSLNNQIEAYHRAQAMLLLEDMANRIRVNSAEAKAGNYLVSADNGKYGQLPTNVNCAASATIAARDLCEWNEALAGTGTALDGGDGADVGGVSSARGCIDSVAGSVDGETILRLTIAWQGVSLTRAPSSTCGQNQYGDDKYRRTASLNTVLADLAL